MTTAARPEPTAVEAWREEAASLVRSESFRHAPALAQLLSYLCEKRFAGESSQIKEYSIGVEVFHRGAGFDQESDSIVRVQVNRLRKRLAEYYAGEGAGHRIQIRIPVGQYVPEFVTIAEAKTVEAKKPRFLLRVERRIVWVGGGVLMAALLLTLLLHRGPRTTGDVMAPAAREPAEALVGPPVGDEVRILAGSTRSYVDHSDKMWQADAWFRGGTAAMSQGQHVLRTQDASFYRSSRQGHFFYDIPLKPGVYELRLHFVETVFGPENSGIGGEGSRLMTVRANGRPLLTHFDVLADAGGGEIADVRVFPDITPARDGFLHLEFASENGGDATVSGIEILPGLHGRMRPVRLLARQTPYYSNDSHWWAPDDYFEGGQLATYADPVSGTDDPEMYETERWGNFSYAIPAAPGWYTVTLYFAARHRGWDQMLTASGERMPAVDHIFSVFCNGKALLENFDLAAEARQTDVAIRKFTGLEANAQGKLLLSFVPVKGYASVTGIEVVPE